MINFINSLSRIHSITLYFLNENKRQEVFDLFNYKVKMHPYSLERDINNKIIRHSFYWLEYSNLTEIIKSEQKDQNFDLIICHDLPVLYPAIKLAEFYKAKLIYDSLEIYNETINQFFPSVNGAIKKIISSLLIPFMRWNGTIAEKYLTNRADTMITVNQSLAHYFQEKYNIKKVHSVMNCPPLIIGKPKRAADFRNIYKFPSSCKIFLYQGVLNEGRGLHLLIKGFKIAIQKNPEIRLVIIGSGVIESSLRELVKVENIEKEVKFFGLIPYKDLLNYTVAADFGINLLESFNLSKKMASPNKLFEYMQAEIPVLCSYSPENDRVFNKYCIGVQCENTVDDISCALIKLSSEESKKLNEYHEQLLKAKLEYNWENQERVLNEIVNQMLENREEIKKKKVLENIYNFICKQ